MFEGGYVSVRWDGTEITLYVPSKSDKELCPVTLANLEQESSFLKALEDLEERLFVRKILPFQVFSSTEYSDVFHESCRASIW
jgi:hypothetical protein